MALIMNMAVCTAAGGHTLICIDEARQQLSHLGGGSDLRDHAAHKLVRVQELGSHGGLAQALNHVVGHLDGLRLPHLHHSLHISGCNTMSIVARAASRLAWHGHAV